MVEVFSNGPFTTRPEIRGGFGCAAATHWLAAATAMRILESGGNAFDAAAAAGFALQVVEPHLNGPAGEVPILYWDAREGKAGAICGQGASPAAATIPRYRALGLDMVPGTGFLAATVPGAVGAWLMMLRDRGTMRLKDVLAPALELAGGGFPLTLRVSRTIASMKPFFDAEWPTSSAVYLPSGEAPEANALFRNPALARTYQKLIDDSAGGTREAEIERAHKLFYEGFVAEAMARFVRAPAMDSSGEKHAGLLTGDDLASWKPTYEAPLARDTHGVTALKCGAWTQGPAFLQWLALLENRDIATLDPEGAEFVHLVIETGKLALADRDAWLGDDESPVDELFDADYLSSRRRLVSDKASPEFRPGSPGGQTPRDMRLVLPGGAPAASGAGEPTFASRQDPALKKHIERIDGDTCHVSVVDRFGNMVSATPSGGWLQSSPVIPELGFCLGTRAQMFWLDEGLPSSLGPSKRPRTTLSPTMILREGKPFLGFGTPGGDQQEQWQIAMLLRVVHHGCGLQQAIDAPAFHTGHHIGSFWPREFKPLSLTLESRFAPAVVGDLKKRGHRVEVADAWALGRLCAVGIEPRGGAYVLRCAANPRGTQDYAIGR